MSHQQTIPTVRNFYTILGVSQFSSAADLRSAFRRSAFRLHPDKNRGRERSAEKRFKELTEAYDVLSDERTRRQYDRRLNQSRMSATFAGRHGGGLGQASNVYQTGGVPRTAEGEMGRGEGGERYRESSDSFRPTIQKIDVEVPLDLIYSGGWYPLTLRLGPHRVERRYLLYVPAGCLSGTRQQVAIHQELGVGIRRGVVEVTIRERKHPFFTRVGENLETVIRTSFESRFTTPAFTITGLDGSTIHVPTPSMTRLKHSTTQKGCLQAWSMIPGVGMPVDRQKKKRGNLFVQFVFY